MTKRDWQYATLAWAAVLLVLLLMFAKPMLARVTTTSTETGTTNLTTMLKVDMR